MGCIECRPVGLSVGVVKTVALVLPNDSAVDSEICDPPGDSRHLMIACAFCGRLG